MKGCQGVSNESSFGPPTSPHVSVSIVRKPALVGEVGGDSWMDSCCEGVAVGVAEGSVGKSREKGVPGTDGRDRVKTGVAGGVGL